MADFSVALTRAIETAIRAAKLRRHQYVLVEHLLLALLQEKDVRGIIGAAGGDVELIEEYTFKHLGEHSKNLTITMVGDYETEQTEAFKRMLFVHALKYVDGHQLTCSHVLLAMYDEQASLAHEYLKRAGAEREKIHHELTRHSRLN